MARALIVGCGCRGRGLAKRLAGDGWAVRGTSRREDALEEIAAAGAEAVAADPDRLGTVTDLLGDVTLVVWLMGSPHGEREAVRAVNGDRLESLVIRLVDTPVRGLVYEAAGSAPAEDLAGGREIVEAASARWQIPIGLITADPGDHIAWLDDAAAAAARAIG